jgi:peroxiredoxin
MVTHAVGAENTPLPIGERFPEFSLRDTNNAVWRLTDYEGRPKVVMFWATWCPYWRRLFPTIVSLHRQYEKSELEMVAVDFDDGGNVKRYAEIMGIEFPIVMDGDHLAESVGVRSTPAIYFLDRKNRITYFHSKSEPGDPILEQAIVRILKAGEN